MRILARSGLALLIAVGTVLLALVSAVSLVFTLAASTYVIRGTEYGVPGRGFDPIPPEQLRSPGRRRRFERQGQFQQHRKREGQGRQQFQQHRRLSAVARVL